VKQLVTILLGIMICTEAFSRGGGAGAVAGVVLKKHSHGAYTTKAKPAKPCNPKIQVC
jgi:hypothetical protein